MRRVLITGGSSGIGLACACKLAHEGARVALLARPGPALDQAARAVGPRAITVAADVREREAVHGAVANAAYRLGGLDALIANAGAAAYGPFIEMEPDDFRLTIETTLLGTLSTVHAALPHLIRTHAEDVADEVLRALDSPRAERIVGGLMAAWTFADALAPDIGLRVTAPVARLAWRRRERQPPQAADALTQKASKATTQGGLRRRRSTLRVVRDRFGIGR